LFVLVNCPAGLGFVDETETCEPCAQNATKCYEGNGPCHECLLNSVPNDRQTHCECFPGFKFKLGKINHNSNEKDCDQYYQCEQCPTGKFSTEYGSENCTVII